MIAVEYVEIIFALTLAANYLQIAQKLQKMEHLRAVIRSKIAGDLNVLDTLAADWGQSAVSAANLTRF